MTNYFYCFPSCVFPFPTCRKEVNPDVRAPPKRARETTRQPPPVVPDTFHVDGNNVVTVKQDTDSETEQPRRKQRKPNRQPAATVPRSPPRKVVNTSDIPPNTGPNFQADVPDTVLSKEEQLAYPLEVGSKLVFSESMCKGSANIDDYLRLLNFEIKRRDGFKLAPYTLEIALELLCENKGDVKQTIQKALLNIPRAPFFPGIKGHFKYEEQCLFVRALSEMSKNFVLISRTVLPERSPSELVWLYYTRHKQLWIQNGGNKCGIIVDDGGEKLKRVPLNSERTLASLRSLATTAGDGFPIDNRVAVAVLQCRRACLIRRKKEREDESFRAMRMRARNQNA